MDETTLQRVQYLETLLSEYKENTEKLEKQISDLGGDPTTTDADLKPRQQLIKELEETQLKCTEAEAGTPLLSASRMASSKTYSFDCSSEIQDRDRREASG